MTHYPNYLHQRTACGLPLVQSAEQLANVPTCAACLAELLALAESWAEEERMQSLHHLARSMQVNQEAAFVKMHAALSERAIDQFDRHVERVLELTDALGKFSFARAA